MNPAPQSEGFTPQVGQISAEFNTDDLKKPETSSSKRYWIGYKVSAHNLNAAALPRQRERIQDQRVPVCVHWEAVSALGGRKFP
jgi:hypothetical protein